MLNLLIFYTYINIKRKNTSLFKQRCMLSFKKVSKSSRIRNQFDHPIFLTNFYKYSYLAISIRLLNLFLYDFLNVSKHSFLKSFKNYNNLINFYNKFIKKINSWKWLLSIRLFYSLVKSSSVQTTLTE